MATLILMVTTNIMAKGQQMKLPHIGEARERKPRRTLSILSTLLPMNTMQRGVMHGNAIGMLVHTTHGGMPYVHYTCTELCRG